MQNPDNNSRTDGLLKDLASDYASYLLVDSSEEWAKLHGVIQNLSSSMDEFSSLLESIKMDTSLCMDSLLPQIIAQYEQVKKTFAQVDQLEKIVKTVEKSVAEMETELSLAESHLGSESVFKSVLRPFLPKSSTGGASSSSSSAQQPLTPNPTYKPVDIFKTEQLFSHEDESSKE